MRCFFAVPIPEDLKKEIEEFQKKLPVGLKKVSPENLHITLKFLGDVDGNSVIKKMRGIKINPFIAKTTGIGFFPNRNFIRVIWLGVEDNGFSRIVREIENRLSINEEKKYVPHITIARARKPLKNFDCNFFPNKKIKVEKIVLYSSFLTPRGPIYKKLQEF